MGDEPVSNDPYETSVLTKIRIGVKYGVRTRDYALARHDVTTTLISHIGGGGRIRTRGAYTTTDFKSAPL